MLFELKCVLAVCAHNHPIMIKIHPVFFFFLNPDKSKPLSHIKPFTDSWQNDAVLHRSLPRLLIDNSVLAQTRPEWAVNSPQLFWRWSRCRQECLLCDWGALLLDVLMNTAIVIYSQHLSRWRRSGLRLFLKGMHPSESNNQPKWVFVHTNHSWSSFTYRRSEYKIFLWIFANRLS